MDKKPESVMTLRLDAEIAEALQKLAAKEGRDASEQVVWVLIEALDKAGLLPADVRDWLRKREALVQRFGLKAVEIIRTEGWRTDIIAETARRLLGEDVDWTKSYESLIDAGMFEKRVKAKERINPMLGRRVKLLLRAETGKPFAVPQPAIFTTSSHLLPPQAAE
jgi:hypothetical protein